MMHIEAESTGENIRRRRWYSRLKGYVIAAVVCAMVAGLIVAADSCRMTVDMEKLRDVSYEVVEEEYIPSEIYQCIEKDMDEINRKSYVCSGELYIVVCYGAQPTEGYSIEVNKLYESTNAIIVETTLIGPSRQEKVEEVISYPYIVLKVENLDKTVVFN